ncbi:unnamed protein product [Alopecurus aequalis]
MLNLCPRLSANAVDSDDNGNVVDTCRVFYAIAVVCISIFVFCVLVASASVAVWKACTFAAMAVLLLDVLGRFAPKTWGRPASALLALTVTSGQARAPGCACVLPANVPVPPAFAYVGGKQEATASFLMCSVCLEDVQGGETVRELPACKHIFHVECVDMWLQSHRTCPMCRSVIKPPIMLTVKAVMTEEVPESSNEPLPPV